MNRSIKIFPVLAYIRDYFQQIKTYLLLKISKLFKTKAYRITRAFSLSPLSYLPPFDKRNLKDKRGLIEIKIDLQ